MNEVADPPLKRAASMAARRLAQLLFVVPSWFVIPAPPLSQGRGDDLRARIDLSAKDQSPKPAAIVGQVMPLFLVEAWAKQVDSQLQLPDQFCLGRMARFGDDDLKRKQILLVRRWSLAMRMSIGCGK